jgi:integrase
MPKRKLTDLFVERAKSPAHGRIEYFDASWPGLALRITENGAKTWCAFYRFHGKLRRFTIGRYPAIKPAEARLKAQAALDRVSQDVDPAAEKKNRRTARGDQAEDVFAEFMAKHLRKRNGEPIRETTRQETGRLLGLKQDPETSSWILRDPRAGVLAYWVDRPVQGITKRDVLDLLDDIVEAGAPVGANRTLSALKTAFAWCVKRDIVGASPCDHIEDPSPETSDERDLSDVELVALWRAAEKASAPRRRGRARSPSPESHVGYPYGRMVQLLLLTGQRRDEVREAVWSEFDLPNRVWKLPGSRTKNGREHHVPLSGAAMTVLESLPRIKSESGWLFTIDGEVPVSNLARRKERLSEAMLAELREIDPGIAGLEPWRLHHLRHVLKTWMQRARIPKDVRNAVQNHFDHDMDELYGHYSFEKEKREALERWAEHVGTIVRGAKVLRFPPRASQ